MKSQDLLKTLFLLCCAALGVAAFCYARVDLGMTVEQINHVLSNWTSHSVTLGALVWLQLAVAGVVWVVYRAWRHRVEQQ